MRCWSYSKAGQRCEMEDDHTLHRFSVTWKDDEAWTPEAGPIAYTPTATPIPIYGLPMEPDPVIDECAICGCEEAAHGREGCEDHDCKQFVP